MIPKKQVNREMVSTNEKGKPKRGETRQPTKPPDDNVVKDECIRPFEVTGVRDDGTVELLYAGKRKWLLRSGADKLYVKNKDTSHKEVLSWVAPT